MYGLAFHEANNYDAAAVTFNTVDWIYGGQIWDPKTKQIQGVINDAARQEGDERPDPDGEALASWARGTGSSTRSTPRSTRARSASASSGSPAWAPARPEAVHARQDEGAILRSSASPRCRSRTPASSPLGGMGMHVSKSPPKTRQDALELHQVVRAARIQKAWAADGGVPARKDALHSPRVPRGGAVEPGTTPSPFRTCVTSGTCPQYAKLSRSRRPTSTPRCTGNKNPQAALNDIAKRQQAVLNGGGLG